MRVLLKMKAEAVNSIKVGLDLMGDLKIHKQFQPHSVIRW
jgi:hypothetical protein